MLERAHPPQREATAEPDVADLLAVLNDADCRAFLDELDEPRTAAELRRCCGVPSSTTYRKLDRLTAVGLVAASTKLRSDGNHCACYRRTVESVTVTLDGDVRFGGE